MVVAVVVAVVVDFYLLFFFAHVTCEHVLLQDLSSTKLRAQIAKGEDIHEVTFPSVIDYMIEHNIYGLAGKKKKS